MTQLDIAYGIGFGCFFAAFLCFVFVMVSSFLRSRRNKS